MDVKQFLLDNKDALPRHIGIIMDGNRRFAKKNGLKPWLGHSDGVKSVERVLENSLELGIRELTLYAFSTENFKRAPDEFKHIMNLFKKNFKRLLEDDELSIKKNKIRIRFIGRLEMFDKSIRKMMDELMTETERNEDLTVNFAMAYGGRYEIVDAVKNICMDVKDGKMDIEDIDEDAVSENLYLNSDVDLLIRTSGEHRISNFLPWQLGYAEFYFEKHLWPEFSTEDFHKALHEYAKRNRRFGN